MILISVDFPAPLSPRSPRTSPFLRCRLMSRSAVTGPNRFEMCSTRSTSSGEAAVGPTALAAGDEALATAGVPSAHTPDVDVGGHRDDHSEAGVEEQVVGLDALQDQAVLEDPEEQRTDQ